MITKLFEATHDLEGNGNYGKFLVCIPDTEWSLLTELGEEYSFRVLPANGWCREHVMVFDLATGEGAMFRPRKAKNPAQAVYHELNKHQIWVCPLFEPFLAWLFNYTPEEIPHLPQLVLLPEADFAFSGYRRPGINRVERGLGWPIANRSSNPTYT